MGINEEIAKAFGAHGAWKARIAQAIDSGHSEHKPEDVAVDHKCAFGKWLHDPSLPASVRSSEEYDTVLRLHADFHRAAGAALAKALTGDAHGAHTELAEGSFAKTSESLSAAMVRWQRNAATLCSGYRAKSWRAACFFWKGSVALRIWAAIAIPALTALAIAVAYNSDLATTATGADRMERATILLAEVTATVHELQKERGLSATAAAKADPAVMARRQAQIEVTDRNRTAVTAAAAAVLPDMPSDLRERWQDADVEMKNIETLRGAIAAGTAAPATVVAGFSGAIDRLITLEEAAQILAVKPDVARAMTALVRVSRAKEAAGRERATGAAALAAAAVPPAVRRRLIELAIDQAVRFSAFSGGATPEQRRVLEQALADPAAAEFEKLRASLAEGEIAGLTPEAWFAAATLRIDLLHRVENHLVAEIRSSARTRKETAWRDVAIFSGLTAASLIFGTLLVIVLTRGITRPVGRLTAAMRRLASGHTAVDVPAIDLPDEIGEMARAVLVFQQQALTVDQMTADRERQRQQNEETRRGALTTMAETIESQTGVVVAKVGEESGRVNATAKRMAQSATRVEDNAQRVAAAAEQSLANAQAVAGASDELSASIREIAFQVGRSKTIVGEAVESAGSASATVASLSEAMAAIDQVVKVIADIASQTNLLALNATIEAARAGEAGKGFAVVAHEVKNLATQTARQTEDITARISTLKEMAERVNRAIVEVVDRIHGVEEIAGGVAAAVEEQDAATKEIARNVQQSAQAAEEVTQRIVAVANEAAATGKQAGMVEAMLEAMAEQVEELDHVLTKVVRTATPDVDRRIAARFAIKAKAKIACGHGEFEGDLADISAGGARVLGLEHGTQGETCTLTVDTVRVPATVVKGDNGICRLKISGDRSETVAVWIDAHKDR
ncbi:MAG: nitrate- and nitrite sensing domain-containing protein [Magnetospirillum sp.]|nr:nitrate- and nitrite sensing domain-containing protein [Magnetospirillum sp.]